MAFAEEDNTPETSGTNEAGGADKAGGADGEDNAGTRGDASKGESIDVDPSVGQTYNVSDGNYVFKGDINPTNIVQDDYALEVAATNRETEVIVEGSVTDTDDNGKACGVSVSASGDNLTATADVSGNVTATGKSDTYGIKASPGSSHGTARVDITVGGLADATSKDGEVSGILVQGPQGLGGHANITVNESVTATGRGEVSGIKLEGGEHDYAYITVAGDVTALESANGDPNAVCAGVNINARQIDLVVGGTISGENGIVATSPFVDKYQNDTRGTTGESDTRIAVWQIKANDNNKPVAYVLGDDDTLNPEKTEILLGMIDYIVKYGDGQEEYFVLSADRNLGSVQVAGSDYQTAKRDTMLSLSIAERAGYTLTRVFGLVDGAALERNADGSYTLVVPDGGGILLRAEWEPKKDDPNDDEEDRTPKDNDDEDNAPKDNDETATATPDKAKPTGIVTSSVNVANATPSVQANDGLPATSDPMSAPVVALVLVAALAGIFAVKSAG